MWNKSLNKESVTMNWAKMNNTVIKKKKVSERGNKQKCNNFSVSSPVKNACVCLKQKHFLKKARKQEEQSF